ncbi:MAG: hypothetical protein MUE40_11680 [Anaerolineae bacterium]|jgi:hypothetical protein|nr:hypothetical protein [Anaerolineae bacterium]
MAQYTLEDKIQALDALQAHAGDVAAASQMTGVAVARLRRWQKEAAELYAAHREQQQARAEHTMSQVQSRLAEASLRLVKAMDDDRVDKAPLNQVAAALGVVIDRYLKLSGDAPAQQEQVIRFEYTTPDGAVAPAPPWAGHDSEFDRPLPGGGVRPALRQDRAGEAHPGGTGPARRPAHLVARPHLPDGQPGLEGFEGDDAERLWYDD